MQYSDRLDDLDAEMSYVYNGSPCSNTPNDSHLALLYAGYLMSGNDGHSHSTTYECVDGNPQYISGLSADQDGSHFYFIKPDCSSSGQIVHCPPYYSDRQLTCVVCSK